MRPGAVQRVPGSLLRLPEHTDDRSMWQAEINIGSGPIAIGSGRVGSMLLKPGPGRVRVRKIKTGSGPGRVHLRKNRVGSGSGS